MSLSQRIVEALVSERKAQGVTQREMAERMGCGVTFIQKLEYDVGDRQISGFERYAKALGVDLEINIRHFVKN